MLGKIKPSNLWLKIVHEKFIVNLARLLKMISLCYEKQFYKKLVSKTFFYMYEKLLSKTFFCKNCFEQKK
jgi:hypothetical protein